MPTVGWIWDSDNDAYYAAKSVMPPPGGEIEPAFPCPFCVASFRQPQALRRHLEAEHTNQRPFMTICGIQPKSIETIRKPIDPNTIEFFDTTSLQLSHDGTRFESITVKQLREILGEGQKRRLWVGLENKFATANQTRPTELTGMVLRGAAARAWAMQHPPRKRLEPSPAPGRTFYDLSFKVYDAEALTEVDKLFVSLLGRENVRMDDVDAFLREASAYKANDYSEALAAYVIAVLTKDADPATGVRGTLRDYRAQFNGALQTLQEYNRPLPNLVSALIRFLSCDFTVGGDASSGSELLDDANARLSQIARDGRDWSKTQKNDRRGRKQAASCPVDSGTATVMWRAEQLASTARWSGILSEQLAAEADVPTLDPLDREKLYALWAQAAVRLGKNQIALVPLRALAGSYCFGQWAESLLSELDIQ